MARLISAQKLKQYAVFSASVYVLFAVCLFFMQRQMIYPGQFDSRPAGLPIEFGLSGVEVVSLTSEDGTPLLSWYLPPADQEQGKVLVLAMGNNDRFAYHTKLIQSLQTQGIGILLVNYRGYQGLQGDPSEQALYQDARANINWLISKQQINPSRIVMVGYSLGSGVASQMADEFTFAGLALFAPFTSMVEMGQKIFPAYPVSLIARDRYETNLRITRLNEPLLVVMGKQDNIVPFAMGQAVYDLAPQPKSSLWLDEADHLNLFDKGGRDRLIAFVKELN
jgi:fermentation-respiration switch protein FrsA (DUF1100 family)